MNLNSQQISDLFKQALARVSKAGEEALQTFTEKYGPRLAAYEAAHLAGDPTVTDEDLKVLVADSVLEASELGIIGLEEGEDLIRGIISAILAVKTAL